MPDWSDHNEHDPGITLLQLAAWLAVGLVFAVAMRAQRRRRRGRRLP